MSATQSGRANHPSLSICSRQGDEMSSSIAIEAQTIVRHAAGTTAGLTVKGQIRQAAVNLGYPAGSWRIREAWYAGAGCWSAQAIRDLQDRYLKWREREAARTAAAQATRAALDLEILEKTRAAHRAELVLVERRIASIQSALRVSHQD